MRNHWVLRRAHTMHPQSEIDLGKAWGVSNSFGHCRFFGFFPMAVSMAVSMAVRSSPFPVPISPHPIPVPQSPWPSPSAVLHRWLTYQIHTAVSVSVSTYPQSCILHRQSCPQIMAIKNTSDAHGHALIPPFLKISSNFLPR